MQTCIKCGHDVSGKKFCPECGTPVVQETQGEVATTSCPRCGGTVRASAAFCMHCGTSLGAQALAAASPPVTVVSQPATRQCIACHAEVPAGSAFCTNCGQSMQPSQAPVEATTGQTFCSGCGTQNHAGADSAIIVASRWELPPERPLIHHKPDPIRSQFPNNPISTHSNHMGSSHIIPVTHPNSSSTLKVGISRFLR